jgi:hypothetical protein
LTFGLISEKINRLVNRVERSTSLQSVLHLNARQLIKMPEIKEADLIHLNIIHSGYFAISDLSKITKLKPTV